MELHPGAVLRNIALRAASWSLQESSETEASETTRGSEQDVHMGLRYDITGWEPRNCGQSCAARERVQWRPGR